MSHANSGSRCRVQRSRGSGAGVRPGTDSNQQQTHRQGNGSQQARRRAAQQALANRLTARSGPRVRIPPSSRYQIANQPQATIRSAVANSSVRRARRALSRTEDPSSLHRSAAPSRCAMSAAARPPRTVKLLSRRLSIRSDPTEATVLRCGSTPLGCSPARSASLTVCDTLVRLPDSTRFLTTTSIAKSQTASSGNRRDLAMAAAKKSGSQKMIYYFGKTRTDGRGDQKASAGRQRSQSGRNDRHRPARPSRIHDHHRGLRGLLQGW